MPSSFSVSAVGVEGNWKAALQKPLLLSEMFVPPASLRMYGGLLIRFGLHRTSKWRLPSIWKRPRPTFLPTFLQPTTVIIHSEKINHLKGNNMVQNALCWHVIKRHISFYLYEIEKKHPTLGSLSIPRQSSDAWPPRCSSFVFTIQISLCPSRAWKAHSKVCSRPCCCVSVCVSELRQKITICILTEGHRGPVWREKTTKEEAFDEGEKKEEDVRQEGDRSLAGLLECVTCWGGCRKTVNRKGKQNKKLRHLSRGNNGLQP